MQLHQVRRSLVTVLCALACGALAGYLGALVRPRPPRAYASEYTAPHPDVVALTLDPAADPAVDRAPTKAPTRAPARAPHVGSGQAPGGGDDTTRTGSARRRRARSRG